MVSKKQVDKNITVKGKTITGSYKLQRVDSDYKPFYYGLPDWDGMNSCSSESSPIQNFIDDQAELDFKSTYVVEFTVKIRKMSKKEYDIWVNKSKGDTNE